MNEEMSDKNYQKKVEIKINVTEDFYNYLVETAQICGCTIEDVYYNRHRFMPIPGLVNVPGLG